VPYGLVRTVEPGALLTTAEAKLWLRVEVADDDALIDALVKAAVDYAETVTGRSLVTQTWRLTLDRFPGGLSAESTAAYRAAHAGERAPGAAVLEDQAIRLPRPRLIAVTALQYVDTAGVTQTLAATEYQVAGATEPARLLPAYGKVWPVTRWQAEAVTVTYTAGYGAAAAVPEGLRLAVKLILAHWYERREETVTGTIIAQIPLGAEALLRSYWTGEIA